MTLSGLAIENSMLGAAHASANPLTARCNTVHGHAVALMLPHVMQINAADPAIAVIYREFSELLKKSGVTTLPLIDWVSQLVERSGLPPLNLSTVSLTELAADAVKQWTGQFNPRALQADDYVALYRRALRVDAAA